MKKNTVVIAMLLAWSSIALGADAPKDTVARAAQKNPEPAAAPAKQTKISDTAKAPAVQNPAASPAAPGEGVKTGWARLRISAQPDSASVVIDSLEKGLTPVLIDSLAAGSHTILVKKKGYFVKKVTTTLAPDSLHEISVVLVKPGCLVVKTDPPGARVFIDNKEAGATPFENAKLKPGTYALRLELTQRETAMRSVTVAEAGCDTVSIGLPFSKAYTDSVERAQKAVKEQKSKFKKTIDLVVIGAFVVFGAVIFFIEAGNAD